MATQRPITAFFASKKRRATDVLHRDAKLLKGDPTLVKFGPVSKNTDQQKPAEDKQHEITKVNPLNPFLKPPNKNDSLPSTIDNKQDVKQEITNVPPKAAEILGYKDEIMKMPTTPRKDDKTTLPAKSPGCDIKTFMTTKSPYRPDCRSETPVKFFKLEGKTRENETTPAKTVGSIMKAQDRPPSAVKKSIRFDDNKVTPAADVEPANTDDIIKAANELVEKMKNRNLSDQSKPGKKPEVMTAGLLKKKLARTAKLAELKSSLSRLGQQASELIKMEKKKKEIVEPKIRKFDAIEVDVPLSPHKGALASPMKSPAKPAYERFAHLVHRTGHSTSTLPLPMGYQKLMDMFIATDTVCSMMLNRGEIITFKKLKQPVQELSRWNLTERHLGQMAAVLPDAFTFRQEKLRNFGSTSKIDRYELVITPNIDITSSSENAVKVTETSNLIVAADRKKMTPKVMLQRKELFHKNLLERTMEKHDEFLASLDPPLNVVHSALTRWHPNFPVDLIPDVPPVSLPEPPTVNNAPTTARDVLEKATKILAANTRMKNALEAVSAQTDESPAVPVTSQVPSEVKAAVDQRLAAHDPLKGISKSLLEKIRAKQAAKALEAMKVTPADEKELQMLTRLPDMAVKLRLLFVNSDKNVMLWDSVVDKLVFSSNRPTSKAEVELTLRRLLSEVPPSWLSVLTPVSGGEHIKLNRTVDSKPIIEKLEKKAADKRRTLS